MPPRDRQAYYSTTMAPTEQASSSRANKPRTLVLCFDGTSNEYDADNTNVVKLFGLLKKDDCEQQLCYYQAGVGTWFEPGVVSPLFHWGAKMLDLAVAWYLDAHVMEGYRFLMENYRSGDRICIFGYSRGSYISRALAGFLYKAGLLPRGNHAQVSFAYKLYKREDEQGIRLCAGFKQTYCQDVKIEFLGVWDTVASVGVFVKRTLPFTNSNRSIKTFRHALALDERRAKFQPNYYHRPPCCDEVTRESAAQERRTRESRPASQSDSTLTVESDTAPCLFFGRVPSKGSKSKKPRIVERVHNAMHSDDTVGGTNMMVSAAAADEEPERGPVDDVLEVWFAGCHSDVGGGSVSNDETTGLCNISLRWMVREIIGSGCGILFDDEALGRANIRARLEPNARDLRLDDVDAIEVIHDELKKTRSWWLLEVLPLTRSWQDGEGSWKESHSMNMGKGRKILDPQPKFHISVQKRMKSHLDYRPQAQWTPGTEVYVF